MVGAAEGITGILVGQGDDSVDNLADSPAFLVGHFFAGRVCRRADTYRHLGALWERGPGLEHNHTVLYPAANDHKAIIGLALRWVKFNGAAVARPRKGGRGLQIHSENDLPSMGPQHFGRRKQSSHFRVELSNPFMWN